VKKVIFQLVGQ